MWSKFPKSTKLSKGESVLFGKSLIRTCYVDKSKNQKPKMRFNYHFQGFYVMDNMAVSWNTSVA